MRRRAERSSVRSGWATWRLGAVGAGGLLLLAGMFNCSSGAGEEPACDEGAAFCNGFSLKQCRGGQWTDVDCAADCENNGYALYGCLDQDNNGVTECVCQPKGTGGSGGTGVGGSGGTGSGGAGGGGVGCQVNEECTAQLPATSPASCAEARCDQAQGVCVFKAKDADGDGHLAMECKSVAGGTIEAGDDCDDGSAKVFPGSEETTCTAGVGECKRSGWRTCDGASVVCSAVAGTPATSDSPCDGKDYNCDGNPLSPPCNCTQGQTTTCNAGSCNEQVVSCQNGAFNCPPPVNALPYCPDKDNDGHCTGACADSCSQPAGFKPQSSCISLLDCNDSDATVNPGKPDLCNGKNDDCDGLTDEDDPSVGDGCTTTYLSTSDCFQGTRKCVSGSLICDAIVKPNEHAETCDGRDNNCEGNVDESWSNLGMTCSVGTGACKANGQYVCKANGTGTECNATGGTPSTEVCDGLDNDCDGRIDDAWFSKGGIVDANTVGAACYQCVGVLGASTFDINSVGNPNADKDFGGNGPDVYARMTFNTSGTQICSQAHVVMRETAPNYSVGYGHSEPVCYTVGGTSGMKLISPAEWPQATSPLPICVAQWSTPNHGPCKACDLGITECQKASWWLYRDYSHASDTGSWSTWAGTYKDQHGKTDRVWGEYVCTGDTPGDDIGSGSQCAFGLSTETNTCVWVEHTPPWPK